MCVPELSAPVDDSDQQGLGNLPPLPGYVLFCGSLNLSKLALSTWENEIKSACVSQGF